MGGGGSLRGLLQVHLKLQVCLVSHWTFVMTGILMTVLRNFAAAWNEF